jgi:hypothetical protein
MMDNNSDHSVAGLAGQRNVLNAGLDLLEEWSETASQAARNTVYGALFAVADGSLFTSFQTVSYDDQPSELAICLRDDLVVTISRTEPGFFDIAFIGAPELAPSLSLDLD